MRARWYEPDLGAFLAPDPLGAVDSWNFYQYGLAEPNSVLDPFGLQASTPQNGCWSSSVDMSNAVDCTIPPAPAGGDAAPGFMDYLWGGIRAAGIYLAFELTDPLTACSGFDFVNMEWAGWGGWGLAVAGAVVPGGSFKGAAKATDEIVEVASGAEKASDAAKGVEKGTEAATSAGTKVRTEPDNLKEQLTMEEAQGGAGKPIMEGGINDPKYKDTHDKIEHTHNHGDGSKTSVHYWKEKASQLLSGFKFSP